VDCGAAVFKGLAGHLRVARTGQKTANVAEPPADRPPDDRSPMAIAFEWSATIMVISAEMVVPGLAGYWLDQRLGTRAVFLVLGFAAGGILATLALVRIAKKRTDSGGGRDHVGKQNHGDLE
jgi:hypothetical protein